MGNRSRGMIIIMVLITMFFIPFFYFSIGPVIKKSKMDGTVEAYKVTFEEIYNDVYNMTVSQIDDAKANKKENRMLVKEALEKTKRIELINILK